MNKPIDSYFKSHDHHRLYYEAWLHDKSRGTLIFVHGLNEHSGRYAHVADYFQKRNYNVYLFDHRGHGKSDGLRSFVDGFSDYLKDVDEFVHLVFKTEQNRKVFLVGHSMGGQIILNYLAKYRSRLAGFVTFSPNILTVLKIPFLKKWIGLKLACIMPKFSVVNEIDCRFISHDPKVVEAYENDPLVSKKITLGLAKELYENQKDILKLAYRIQIPALMMHGSGDQICHVDGSKKFFRRLASEDKTLKIFDGFYHELFNESEKDQVLKVMDDWLAKRT